MMAVTIHLKGPIRGESWCRRHPECCVYSKSDANCTECLTLCSQHEATEATRKSYVESHDMNEWHPITRETLPLGGSWLFWSRYAREADKGLIENRNQVSGCAVIWIGGSANGAFDSRPRYTHYRALPPGPTEE